MYDNHSIESNHILARWAPCQYYPAESALSPKTHSDLSNALENKRFPSSVIGSLFDSRSTSVNVCFLCASSSGPPH
jgi:hypothetical protein